ncbi:MAG: hypothetical protein PHY47_00540 [Lachnospiraceae bacterium]|nr:hypothetical protein [Lachnospiraceae bacterium]
MIKVFRIAKRDNVYSGPFRTDEFVTAWEFELSLMNLKLVKPLFADWLYGFTETQFRNVIDRRIMKNLYDQGYGLYIFELPKEAVQVFEDQVCFNPSVMEEHYAFDKTA